MTQTEALKLALEALEWNLPVVEDWGGEGALNLQHKAITAIREVLAQPEQEPVCAHGVEKTKCSFCYQPQPEQEYIEVTARWGKHFVEIIDPTKNDGTIARFYFEQAQPEQVVWTEKDEVECPICKERSYPYPKCGHVTYTTPPHRKPLTDEEIKIIWRDIDGSEGLLMRFARAIEAAHGIKD